MINAGNRNASNIYIGNREVSEISIGSVVVFSKGAPPWHRLSNGVLTIRQAYGANQTDDTLLIE